MLNREFSSLASARTTAATTTANSLPAIVSKSRQARCLSNNVKKSRHSEANEPELLRAVEQFIFIHTAKFGQPAETANP